MARIIKFRGTEFYVCDVAHQLCETTISNDDAAYTANGKQTDIDGIRIRAVCPAPYLSENDVTETSVSTKNILMTSKRSEIIGNNLDNSQMFEGICNP